jgi:hypothetical protein
VPEAASAARLAAKASYLACRRRAARSAGRAIRDPFRDQIGHVSTVGTATRNGPIIGLQLDQRGAEDRQQPADLAAAAAGQHGQDQFVLGDAVRARNRAASPFSAPLSSTG